MSRSPTRWQTKSTGVGPTQEPRMRTRPVVDLEVPRFAGGDKDLARNRAFPPTHVADQGRRTGRRWGADDRLSQAGELVGVSGGSSTRSIIPSRQSRAVIGSGRWCPTSGCAAGPASPVATELVDQHDRCVVEVLSTSSLTSTGRRRQPASDGGGAVPGAPGAGRCGSRRQSDARLPSGSTADPGWPSRRRSPSPGSGAGR